MHEHTEKFYLVGCNAVYSVESQPAFRRNTYSLYLQDWGVKPSKKRVGSRQQEDTDVGFLIGLLLNPEDEGDMFLRNIEWRLHGVISQKIEHFHNHYCENLRCLTCIYILH
jgi:hypothetical protein